MKYIKDSIIKYGETLVLGDFLRLEEDTDGRVLIRVVGAGGGGITLDDLNDVVITTATTNQTLRYNGTNWVNNGFLSNTGSAVLVGSDPGGTDALRVGSAFSWGDGTSRGRGFISSTDVVIGSATNHDVLFMRNAGGLLRLTASVLKPESAGGVDLGTAGALPWGNANIGVTQWFHTSATKRFALAAEAADVMSFYASDGSTKIKLSVAADGKIIPSTSSLSWRNNADSADNLKILDTGESTFRNSLSLSAGLITVQSEKNAQVKWSTSDPSGTPPDGTIWIKY